MEFMEKVRLDNWIHHNEHHTEEYEIFADQLEEAGMAKSAGYIREMVELTSKSTDCLKKALKSLE